MVIKDHACSQPLRVVDDDTPSAMARALLTTYNRWLIKRPVLTQSVTTAGLYSLGDAIAHSDSISSASIRRSGPDPTDGAGFRRNFVFLSYGGVLHAPSQHVFFGLLERTVGAAWKSPDRIAAARVVVHSFTFAPLSIIG